MSRQNDAIRDRLGDIKVLGVLDALFWYNLNNRFPK